MLSTASFQNYRGFSAYRMDGLTPVNLLVGKNNSGKTALLEGIQFLTSGGQPAVLGEVARRRGEVMLTQPERETLADVSHFFHGHNLAPDYWFSISGAESVAPVSVGILSVNSGMTLNIADRPSIAGGDRIFSISPEGGVNLSVGVRSGTHDRKAARVRFVGPDSLNSNQLAEMWDDITLSRQEGDVASAMRILDDHLESVHFLTGMFAAGFFPARSGIVIGFDDKRGRVPLGSLGDGMRRLMALATALAFTKGGYLFVDEIDTGLHYSVMADMWKLLVKRAVSSGTQVFATTHSWDCIEGLSLFCQREPMSLGAVSVHKIDQSLSHDVPFSGESLVRMVKSDIDPR